MSDVPPVPDLPDLGALTKEFVESVQALKARTHPEIGIVGAAVLEERLEQALLAKMRPLNNATKKRIFDGYGPLSSFAAKVDLSYALHIIDEQVRDDLELIRKIRNQFAHSRTLVSFASPEILQHFQHFNIPVDANKRDYLLHYYLNKLDEVDTYLEHVIGPTSPSADSAKSDV